MPSVKNAHSKKRRIAFMSVLAASFLAILKLAFGIISGSLTILASSIDSILDIVASFFNYLSIKEGAKPPDKEHGYGHGKVESLAALFQSVIIFGSAVFIIYKGGQSIVDPAPISYLEEGIIVMLISTIVSIYLTLKLRHAGKKYDSEVLITDSLHYATDIYQNLGVLITIGLIYLTGLTIFDPIVAFIIGAYIISQVWGIFRKAFDTLMDHELPEEERKRIKEIILSHKKAGGIHNFRTRKAGSTRFIDFHLELSPSLPLREANLIAHEIEAMIQNVFPNTEILIHPDPYDDSKLDIGRKKRVYEERSS